MAYRVDTLLDKRTRNIGRRKVVEYLVKWEGYGHEHNTWETEANIEDPDLIEALNSRMSAPSVLPSTRRVLRARRCNT